ncbi:MAG: nucleoside deaminase [Acidimicrobiia bacterium]|nr:nucleoside deaminase [Acidimicrobiia bacterium]
MRMALEEAALAPTHGDVPVGAVLVSPAGEVVARDHNRREERSDPTAHAEMLVIAEAAKALGDWRLDGHTLYVTLEPCVMCSGALVWARIGKVVYAAADLKAGGTWSLYNIPGDVRLNHQVEIEAGLLADDAAELLTSFFRERR